MTNFKTKATSMGERFCQEILFIVLISKKKKKISKTCLFYPLLCFYQEKTFVRMRLSPIGNLQNRVVYYP